MLHFAVAIILILFIFFHFRISFRHFSIFFVQPLFPDCRFCPFFTLLFDAYAYAIDAMPMPPCR